MVWATKGYDVAGQIKPATLSVVALLDALSKSRAPPRVIVLWMAFGAQRVAQQLLQVSNAASVTIIWLKSDPHAPNALRHFCDTIAPAVQDALNGSSKADIREFLQEQLDIPADCVGAEPSGPIAWNPGPTPQPITKACLLYTSPSPRDS